MTSTSPHAPTRRAQRTSRVGRLPRWQRLATYAILVCCALSGLLFFMAHDADLNVTGLSSHTLLMLHGISAQAALLTLGAVMPIHIRLAWNARSNRSTGVLLCSLLSVLIASGLWLYYGSEDLRDAAVWSHWVFGGLGLVLFPLHVLWGQYKTHAPAPSP
jgi:hypothetical protein